MRRLVAILSSLVLFSLSIQSIAPAQATDLNLIGPGGRIHGADISRWQHPDDKAIDFQKMHDAGVAFVMIKASDTRDDADQLSVKYLKTDRAAARAEAAHAALPAHPPGAWPQRRKTQQAKRCAGTRSDPATRRSERRCAEPGTFTATGSHHRCAAKMDCRMGPKRGLAPSPAIITGFAKPAAPHDDAPSPSEQRPQAHR